MEEIIMSQELLDKAVAAFKSDLDIDDLSNFILNPAQQTQFMEAMEVKSKLLSMIRRVTMDRSKQNIDSIQFYGRVTVAGAAANGSVRVLDDDDKAEPVAEQNILDAVEMVASAGIYDRTLRRVLGKQTFGPFLLNLLGNAHGRDKEELAFFGNTNIVYTNDDLLSQTDGFAVSAGNQLFGAGSNKDFDPAAKQFPLTLFDAMIEALPERYFDDPSQLCFMIDQSIFLQALDLWGLRNTALGDQVLSTGVLPPYKGITPVYMPLLSRAKSSVQNLTDGHTGRIAMLQNVSNMNEGVFKEVSVEPKRVPEARKSEWYLSCEGDIQYQEKNAAVTAFIERESL